ncbi:hypothetical protein [Methanobrevibacter sp. UBA188]|uniref:hypothetical protein n=1 Tax=Methanobrevibacter sp. UBA188 TaxID=1915473 RepID=UPI0025F72A89|nr:hypothetical protein [Methanobrevibacter sp. UBA188]
MSESNNQKIEELRLLFERENNRKQNLENKASYFLGIISIITTIICAFSNQIKLIPQINNYFGILILITLIISFSMSIILFISIFLPRDYYHPFDIKDIEKLEKSFKVENEQFNENLFDQYFVSIYTNCEINDKLVVNLKYAIYFFICFIFMIILNVVII